VGDNLSVTDSLSNQGAISYTYNADQQVTGTAQSFGGTTGPQVAFSYDGGGRMTSVSRTDSNSPYYVNTTIVYDAANRVATMTDGADYFQQFGQQWVNNPIGTYTYSYDNANRVTGATNAEGAYTYTYDKANELTGVSLNGTQAESYSYDLNGNRNSSGYTTGTNNELTASPGYTYTYDKAGNMVSATDTSTQVVTSYTYDYENRLTQVTTGGSVVASYTYNALDQRIGINDNGTQTWTVYDGTSADAHPYADFNGLGSLTVRYLFGPTVVNGVVTTGILARTSANGSTAWYLTDKLGSVRDIVDTSGNELDHIVYDSFGNILSQSNAANGDRFMFAGMQFDATTGQYYDNARWYGSGVGRFLSQDPTGFAAGDTNLDRYVGNGPSNATDPSGRDGTNNGAWVYMGSSVKLVGYQSMSVPGGCAGQNTVMFPVYQTTHYYAWQSAPPSQVQSTIQSPSFLDPNVNQAGWHDFGVGFGPRPELGESVTPVYTGGPFQNAASFGPGSPGWGGYRREITSSHWERRLRFHMFRPRWETVEVPDTWIWVPK